MPTYKITGRFSVIIHDADDKEDALAKLNDLFDDEVTYDIPDVEEEGEYERCENCSKKVKSLELEQNQGVCYVCAHPDEFEEI